MEPKRSSATEEPRRYSVPEEVLQSFAASLTAIQNRIRTPSAQRFSSTQEARAATSSSSSKNTQNTPSSRFVITSGVIEGSPAAEEARAAAAARSPQPPSSSSKNTQKPSSSRFVITSEVLKGSPAAEEARAAAAVRSPQPPSSSSKNTQKPSSSRFVITSEVLKESPAADEARASAVSRSPLPPSERFVSSPEGHEAARAAEEARSSASARYLEKPSQPPSKRLCSSSEEHEALRDADEVFTPAFAGSPKDTPQRSSKRRPSSTEDLEALCAAWEVSDSASLRPPSKRIFSSAEEFPTPTFARSPKKIPKLSSPSTSLASFPPPEHQHHSPQPVHQLFSSIVTNPASAAVVQPITEHSAAGSWRSTSFQQWLQPSPQPQEFCASRSEFRPQVPIPPIPPFGFHIPPQSYPQIPIYSYCPWPPPPGSPAPPPLAILRKKDGSPADYATHFSDLCDESQTYLLQIEMRIQEYREESKQLDQCIRPPIDHFDLQFKKVFQDVERTLSSVEKQKVPTQQTLDSLRTMMQHVQTAIHSCNQSFMDRNLAGTSGVPRFYRGIPTKPSPYMLQTATRFGSELTELLRSIEEIEENLKVTSSRGCSLESIPNTISNMHQALLQVAAKVEDIHQSVEGFKRAYLTHQGRKGNTANPFLEADRQEAVQQRNAARKFHPAS